VAACRCMPLALANAQDGLGSSLPWSEMLTSSYSAASGHPCQRGKGSK
jgi:hypothetical protein